MYEGKQKSLTLIRELRLEETASPTSTAPTTSAPTTAQQQQQLDVGLDTLQGEVLSDALDFISKEIVRVSEERKIAALVKQVCCCWVGLGWVGVGLCRAVV
jgi:hypothetical protein